VYPTSAPATQAPQFSTASISNIVGFIDYVFNRYNYSVQFVLVVPDSRKQYFASNSQALHQLYPQLFRDFADSSTPNGNKILQWMTTRNFAVMTMEDIEETWDFCPEGNCMFVHVDKVSASPSLFLHEVTHIDQARQAGRDMPRHMWGNQRQETNLNTAYRSIQEGYAEYRAQSEGGHFVGSGYYANYRVFYFVAETASIPSFPLARMGDWNSFCTFMKEYTVATNKSLSQLLNEAGWGANPDETDSYTVEQCQNL